MTQRIAAIGLGAMGLGMAQSLKRAGFAATGCEMNEAAVARFVARLYVQVARIAPTNARRD